MNSLLCLSVICSCCHSLTAAVHESRCWRPSGDRPDKSVYCCWLSVSSAASRLLCLGHTCLTAHHLSPSLSTPRPPVQQQFMQRGGSCVRGGWRLTSLPLLQERLVAPPCLPELKRAGGRRPFDYEASAAATPKMLSGKLVSSCYTTATSSSSGSAPVLTPPSHRAAAMLINGWQESAIDLTKTSAETNTAAGGTGEAVAAPGCGHHAGSSHKLPPPPITAPLGGAVGMDIAGILQAGLIHPVTGQIVNGSLRGDDSLRRRRGRRRNVEALYSEFTKSRGLQTSETQVGGGSVSAR